MDSGLPKVALIWARIVCRCCNPDDLGYRWYGGRGIKICKRWLDSPEAFAQDMGPRPNSYSVDRIDPDGDYRPENCRWASKRTQARNRRNTIYVTYRRKRLSLATLCEQEGAEYGLIYSRLRNGMKLRQALAKPKRERKPLQPIVAHNRLPSPPWARESPVGRAEAEDVFGSSIEN